MVSFTGCDRTLAARQQRDHVHADGLRVLEAGPELLAICSRSHDACVHDKLLPLVCLNTALHFKCLKLHKTEAGRP